jgi:hypothetical protein
MGKISSAMKMLLQVVASFLAFIIAASPVIAGTTVIARLGTAPLLGQSVTAPDLQAQVSSYGERVVIAAGMLGLSPSEYREFHRAIDRLEVKRVVLPRHLEAMAFYSNGAVRVIRDVTIPAETSGWEVDVVEPGQTIRILMPASCGNLSILRTYHPAVAARISPPQSKVKAQHELAPQRAAIAPTPAAMPATPPPAVAAVTTPAPLPQAPSESGHRGFFWPIFLLPIALFFFHGGGSESDHNPPHGGCGCRVK